jgi:aspartate-semialdehyde dehydrogenase
MVKRIPVAVLGATGSIGQRFVQLLATHPWFELAAVTGSERTVGRSYGEACHWVLAEPMPEAAKRLPVLESDPQQVNCPLVFSALPSGLARQLEPGFASSGSIVCSNASAFREDADVPILLPEVNPDHAALIKTQRQRRGWLGAIVTNPNCTSTGFTIMLQALQAAFGVRRALAISLQAISGAGYPGVASLDIQDNVIPNIDGEEAKVEWEPRKILGRLEGEQITLADVLISAHTNRVAVSDGHLVCASLEFDHAVSPEAVHQALEVYRAPEVSCDLPSAPHPVILVRREPDRPQPRLDRWTGNGMTTVVGRVRPDPLLHVKLVVLSHNTVRGAAGGSIYNAELLVRIGLLPGFGER